MSKKVKELLKYGINGVLTTLVNYLVFYLLYKIHVNYLVANTVAWMVAVITAYFTNRLWVFGSSEKVVKEFLSFASLRLLTLLIENILLFIFIQLFYANPIIAKCSISVITILGNYMICRNKIFLKGENTYG
ncbi:putative flippase GtrA [Breznakia sp. PF5-3]|uniref:GtrA family protein n=1 Tax=unclassified Breznakia TaxID=2623764 RepID=UPI00240659A1|nr:MULTISPECIES: GtrA family protein [unclassified Breznakia]MDL2276651.1 GtrA family protein [Breznakia sp. OttesenSCG-928-G09]MDF9824825.1 putative flippase GtrA [Breznakia sp. PM6-1]MDF9835213.1 putative flippase GtrA [Breznakia sp. PF5-3]MDF9837325.1 putative flippase GtrA [Breznakia sp. PFB2-8]MDF9859751.1 putative flippase GtrA [Breznakia sp. PH5-24]